jgi:hypothetical protein
MGRLADSLLIIVDCSNISYRAIEILFMNSRDRLGGGDLRKELEEQLEDIIHRHHGLKELRDRRKSQEISERIKDSKPLEEVLHDIFKSSPSLTSLFLTGHRLSKPHKQMTGGTTSGEGDGVKNGMYDYSGKEHPTYFKFKKKKYGELFKRNCEIGRRSIITFETDVVNSYFKRNVNQGKFILEKIEGGCKDEDINWNITLHNGIANLSIELPDDLTIGDVITLQLTVTDDVITEPFVNVAKLYMIEKRETTGKGVKRNNSYSGNNGQQPEESGIQLPKIHRIREEDWNGDDDRFSACRIVQDEDEDDINQDVYEFYVNVDNHYLRTDMKHSKEDPKLIEDKFVYGNVLFGVSLIKHYRDQV